METKRLILLMAIGMLVIFGWTPLMHRIGERMGWDMTVKPAPTTAPILGDAAPPPPPLGDAVAATAPSMAATTNVAASTSGFNVAAATQPAAAGDVALGQAKQDEKNPYAIAVKTSAQGAGLGEVVLNDYKLDLRTGAPFAYERPGQLYPYRTRAMAVRGVTIDGVDVDLTRAIWSLVEHDADDADGKVAATYELTVTQDGKPTLTLRRTFTVYTRTGGNAGEADGSPLGFEMRVLNSFRNLTDRPLQVALKYNGQGVPPSESERYLDAFYVIGTGRDGAVKAHGYAATSTNDKGHDLLADYKAEGQPWYVGALTSYFVALQRFEPPVDGKAPADRFASVVATALTVPEGQPHETEVLITLKPVEVAPGGESSFASRLYFGPKKREFLTNAHYAQPWIRYDQTLVLAQSWWICGLCTWQWLIDVLFSVLKAFHFVTRDWGLAIIGLTCLVRIALHPITKKAQMNMLKFGKLAPEMERIKKKYANDQDAMNRAMMGFYKEHGTTQVMGCLPMFLQMPIWIALWQAMNTTFELRHQPFLYGLTWIDDLSKPDHLIDFANHGWGTYHLPLLSFVTISGFNILPIIFGFLQFLQFKAQPKPPTMTEEQRQQQAMTQWMMLIIFPLFMYASPSGLLIYMITSFTIGIIESKIVKKQFAAQSEQEARFTVVDDGEPAPANVQKATVRRKAEAAPKQGGLMGMIAEARRKAEEMQREIEKNRKRGR